MARRSRKGGRSVSLTGPLLEGFMLLQGFGGGPGLLATGAEKMSEENTAKVVLTMIHLALVEKDQSKALAIVTGLVQAARSGKKEETAPL